MHALGYDGSGSTVAVLGTGVSKHPDLKDRIIEERCYCAYVNGKGCCPNGATEQFGSGSARDDLVVRPLPRLTVAEAARLDGAAQRREECLRKSEAGQ